VLLNAERASRLMDENGLDGLLATTSANVHYLSGLRSISLVLSPLEAQIYALVSREKLSEPVVVVTTGDIDTAMDCFPGVRIINYGTFYREVAQGVELTPEETRLKGLAVDRAPKTDPLGGLAAALEEAGLTHRSVGLDEKGIDPAYPPELNKRFPGLKIKPAASIFKQIRMVKTEEEIKRLRAAVQITEKAMLEAVSIAKEGVTEGEMAKEFGKALIDQGAHPLLTHLRIGRLSAFGLRRPGDTPLRKGDRIYFEVGCRYQGYCSEFARTFAFGEVGRQARGYHQAILDGEERGLETIKAGVKAEDVFHATVAAVRKAGIPHFRRHHVGHGIGIDIYDSPLLAPGDETILEEGMVLNIETRYYEIGTGALAVEDTLVVSRDRPGFLTSTSRKLEVLE
jgi:Xaa-Pro dipeptidase